MKSMDPLSPAVFEEFFHMPLMSCSGTGYQRIGCEVPAVNILDGKNEVGFEMAAPGLKKEDLNLHLENGVITVSC